MNNYHKKLWDWDLLFWIAVYIAVCVFIMHILQFSNAQEEDFQKKCEDRGGTYVHNGRGGHPSYLCLDPSFQIQIEPKENDDGRDNE